MFTKKSFGVFTIEGLDARMAAIRSDIQPVFQEIGEYVKEQLEKEIHEEFFIHIAQHRRRTVYPPENTWSALSTQKRGYKMSPHFQLGIWADYVFIWLSFIDNPQNEREIAQVFLEHQDLLKQLPTDFYVSSDHTKPTIEKLNDSDIEKILMRFRDVKKGEFQVGRIIPADSTLWQKPEEARNYIVETYKKLVPLYKLSCLKLTEKR